MPKQQGFCQSGAPVSGSGSLVLPFSLRSVIPSPTE
jgi:hypothetical protein